MSHGELKPCPFCGGEAVLQKFNVSIPGRIICACSAEMRGYRGQPLSELIAAWNSRAERTCECIAEYAKSPIDGKTIVLHRCSACTELMRPHMSYCPYCGARRVGE